MKKQNLQGQVVRLETENLHLKNEIERLNKECDAYMKIATKKENIIKEVRHWVKLTIDIIKQQSTGNDEWILERLNGFLKTLDKEKDNDNSNI